MWRDSYFGQKNKSELLIALALADFADYETGCAWPSIERLAQKARTSIRGAQESVKIMAQAGKVRVEIGAGENGTNRYFLLYAPAAIAPPAMAAPRNGAAAKPPDEAAAEPAAGCTQSVRNRQEAERTVQKPPILSDGFDEFWSRYPKKLGKAKAIEAWKRKGCAKLAAEIAIAISLAVKCEQWTREDGRFIPHPTTWINRGGWDDEYESPKGAEAEIWVPGPEIDYMAQLRDLKAKEDAERVAMGEPQWM